MADHKQFEGFYVPNSTQVPDDIFDVWMPILSGAEFKVLMYIARRTLGFKKQRDAISISQMVHGITKKTGEVLDKGTGLSRASAISAAKSLETQGLIVRNKQHSAVKGDEATTYSLKLAAVPEKKATLPAKQLPNPQESSTSEGESNFYTPPGGPKNILPPSPEFEPGGVQKVDPQGTVIQDKTVNVNNAFKKQKPSNPHKSKLCDLPNLEIPEEAIEEITKKLVQTFDDDRSRGYFRLAASKIPRNVITRMIGEIRKQNPEYPSKLFTFRIELYAKDQAQQALATNPTFQQASKALTHQFTMKSRY